MLNLTIHTRKYGIDDPEFTISEEAETIHATAREAVDLVRFAEPANIPVVALNWYTETIEDGREYWERGIATEKTVVPNGHMSEKWLAILYRMCHRR